MSIHFQLLMKNKTLFVFVFFFFTLKHSDVVFTILLINLIFAQMSRINEILSSVEYVKSIITSMLCCGLHDKDIRVGSKYQSDHFNRPSENNCGRNI